MAKQRTGTVLWILYFALVFSVIIISAFNPVAARYNTGSTNSDSATVAPFAPRLVINLDNPPLNYSNVDANLSSPIDVCFKVQNYTEDVVTAVDMKYSLIFYIPKDTFAKTAMLQLLEDNAPITPLYKISDLMGGADHDTSKNRYKDYVTVTDEKLTPSVSEGVTTFTVTKIDADNTPAGTITVETVKMQSEYYLLFGVWQNETTLLDPTLKVSFTDNEAQYLKITVSRPEFVLKSGAKTEDALSLRILPSTGMTSASGGSAEIDGQLHTEWAALKGEVDIENMEIIDKPKNQEWNIVYDPDNHKITLTKTVGETTTTYTDVLVGHMVTIVNSDGVTVSKVRASCGKNYPCRLNAVFEQIQPTVGP